MNRRKGSHLSFSILLNNKYKQNKKRCSRWSTPFHEVGMELSTFIYHYLRYPFSLLIVEASN